MKLLKWMAGAAVAASAISLVPPTLAGAETGSTEHWTAPAEGAIQCGSTTLTMNGGEVDGVEHISVDGQGVEHRADSMRFVDVTLTDGTDDYVVRGAGGSGGTEGSDHGRTAHLVGHFVIRDGAGRLFGRVAIVAHVYRDGTLRWVEFGSCSFDDV